MSLELVSQTYRPDRGERPPVHTPIFTLKPPLNLANSQSYVNGHPYDVFAQMREEAPVMWHPMKDSEGYWALTRYEDIRRVSLDTETFSSQKGGILQVYFDEARRHPLLHRATLDTIICLDPPNHMKLRREHMAYFTPKYIKTLKAKVDVKITALLDQLEQAARDHKGIIDFVPHFSEKLPLFTLCEMLGIPETDRQKIAQWMQMLEQAQYTMEQINSGQLSQIDPAQVMHFMQEVQALFDYGQYILRQRRKDPQDDLLSAIANAKIDGELLPDEYLDGAWLLVIFAGNDTTRNSLTGTMRLLTQFPEAKAELINAPEKLPNAINEAMRMVTPVIYMRRTLTKNSEIAGQKIAEGEKVVMFYGAANRDPAIFEKPDTFNIDRANAKEHMAFGYGPHVCLGQRIGMMQLEAAYSQILRRFPNMHWTGEQVIAPNNFTHSMTCLKVDLGKG